MIIISRIMNDYHMPSSNIFPRNSALRSLHYFLTHIEIFVADQTIQKYLSILGLDHSIFKKITSEDFYLESNKLVRAFFRYPTIAAEIFKYISSKKSKLDFLERFSVEQINYITNLESDDSKLIACAGSGKTRSIIGRIRYLVVHRLAKKEEIFAITFSRHAAADFHQKIKELFPDFESFCQLKNFSTIDSLAKSILCRVKSHKSENVEILSIAFRNYLRCVTESDVHHILQIKKITHLFIDEAQDLNEVQYEAIMLLKQKLGTRIHLIGDPNQNIFQFRRSSSTYLINFSAKTYHLTLNFRSTQEIINFSEGLKPVKTSPSVSATQKHGPPVTIMTKPMSEVHRIVLEFIKLYGQQKDLSNIAIICPTRGIGSYDNIGLSVLFNLFKIHNIPFKQLYDESGLNDERKKDVLKVPGHLNLLTYHGTKGLEFDVVFVMDFYQFLFNIKPSKEEHQTNRYLLYVAATRAISMMYICTYTNMHDGYLNHWITDIKPDNYMSNSWLRIPHLTFRNQNEDKFINGITELITEMTDEQLNMVHDMLQIREENKIFTRRIYADFSQIDRGKDETLFGILCEELFYLQYFLSRRKSPRRLKLIQMIIESKFIVIQNETDYHYIKKYIQSQKLTWERYDLNKNNFPQMIRQLIEKYFSRDKELTDCVICTNEFVRMVDANLDDIRTTYQRYLSPKQYHYDYRKILVDFFYLIVVQYAYDINHYYYICHHGKEKATLLENGTELFEAMNQYVGYHYLSAKIRIKIPVQYEKMMLCGEIDFLEKYDSSRTIVEIKCVKELSIRYYIQLMLYNFCYYYQKQDFGKPCSGGRPEAGLGPCRGQLFCNKFKILNLLTGLEHIIIIKISPANMFNLLILLAEIGGLHLSRMNLVYDLETNNAIQSVGPFNAKQNIPRTIWIKKGNQYYGRTYPEIIEIAIKDYESGMILLDTLVQPDILPGPQIQDLTHITPTMLVNQPKIDIVKSILQKKMKNFIYCKMLAHNGNRFDNPLILFEKLIDPLRVSFLDTLSIIPIHLPDQLKLESKSLGNIYFQLFGKSFRAHRAISDVNALIKIMKYLKIEF